MEQRFAALFLVDISDPHLNIGWILIDALPQPGVVISVTKFI